jgi:calcineurin-like phosphoesterase family protein
MRIWLTSDSHFNHANIIGYANRPFVNVEDMNEAIIDGWNSLVKPQDHVYHLGDVTMDRNGSQRQGFIQTIKRLRGHKRLILGNHDHFPMKVYTEAGFDKIFGMWGGIERLMLTHAPVHPRSIGSAIANIHGHTHISSMLSESYPPVRFKYPEDTRPETIKPYINVCVEATNFLPVPLETILDMVRGIAQG